MNQLKPLLFILAAGITLPAISATLAPKDNIEPQTEAEIQPNQTAESTAEQTEVTATPKKKPVKVVKDPYPAQYFDLRTTLRLKITLPTNFVAYSSEDKFITTESDTIEYLPKGEKPENWSSVFAISKQPGGFPLKQYIEIFTDEFKNITQENVVYGSSVQDKGRYETGTLTLGFKEKGRPQITYMRFFFSDKIAVSIHYTTHVPEGGNVNDIINKAKSIVDGSISFQKLKLTPLEKPKEAL